MFRRVFLDHKWTLYWAVVAVLFALAAVCFERDRRDQAWVAALARRVVQDRGARTRAEQVVALRDHVRQRVGRKGALYHGRPFPRSTARETLESGLGYCGESTRAFLAMAESIGVEGYRVYLYGESENHVVAEVELQPGRHVLVDPQDNPETNALIDRRAWTAEELVRVPVGPFANYSNLNFKRLLFFNTSLLRFKLRSHAISRVQESPWLIRSAILGGIGSMLVVFQAADAALIRVYAYRCGVRVSRPWRRGARRGPANAGPSGEAMGATNGPGPEATDEVPAGLTVG